MFARYAYAPNQLGYCGPSDKSALSSGSVEQIRAAARRFSGAWPYLQVLSRMTGVADPLDRRLVESYWLGGGLGADLDPERFLGQLLAVIGPQAGRYWLHLSTELADEAAANHCFHVFGVYPWSRLLGKVADAAPVRILDSCRITPATVLTRRGDRIEVRCRQLSWDGRELRLTGPAPRQVQVWVAGYSAVPDVAPGDRVALHWDRLCGRLDPAQVSDLQRCTTDQLAVTNRRLSG
ncbi:DUF6390 family protein [[Mycobacterium] burgundiense]|uniref:DUF6390 family protein n=1 Tax=[Mycobacterium] burgundiense TaxID=3064286 RepID=A0ABM9LYM1_9MYCO|nr:DUF6390 family protein [Mycolicibacterium sp. MU0053]CAJ1506933.1 DUF6390 family protein [Mycolicibacterium sp. MU0053]